MDKDQVKFLILKKAYRVKINQLAIENDYHLYYFVKLSEN